jgi:hypothetical protein
MIGLILHPGSAAMVFARQSSRRCGIARSLWVVLFLLPPLQPAAARAGQPGLPAATQTALTGSVLPTPAEPLHPPQVSTALLAEGWKWRNLLHLVESLFGSRRRMIQLAMVGMCIGLYILMRR